MRVRHWIAPSVVIAMVAGGWGGSHAQDKPAHAHPGGAMGHKPSRTPVRVTMDELHRHGGVPRGWRFTLPAGDATEGRKVFAKLECFSCHAVRGEEFGAVPKRADDVGPELTGMGLHHPAEYLAESVVSPNAVIVTGPGYTGSDGLSRMPEYNDVLTVRELIDLVAYLQGLTGGHGASHGPHGKSGARPSQHKRHGSGAQTPAPPAPKP